MKNNKLSLIIENHQKNLTDEPRNYIGASSIGSECWRQIWYASNGVKAEGIVPKMRRTWNIGSKLEELVIEWLERAGMKLERSSFTYTSKKVPRFQGHIDGAIYFGSKKFILEIKTAKHSSFTTFVAKGLKEWNPQYYAQVQSYMGLSGINSAYILVLNKDNSDLFDEFVFFDEEYFKSLEDKAMLISKATVEPPRINASPLWYQCKMCSYNKTCHR